MDAESRFLFLIPSRHEEYHFFFDEITVDQRKFARGLSPVVDPASVQGVATRWISMRDKQNIPYMFHCDY
jgi:hypothetical protein